MVIKRIAQQASALLILSSALEAQEARAQQVADTRDLVPVVAFDVNETAALLDVAGIEGSFPKGFRLTDLPEPPFESLIVTSALNAPEAYPDYTVGVLAAVPRDHAPALRKTKGGHTKQSCSDGTCTDQIHVCTPDESRCTDATLTCNRVGKDCTITAIEGDPRLLRQSLYLFEGRASDTALLYVADDAPAGSLVSQLYANGAALAQGYHLLERRPAYEEAQELELRCQMTAQAIVLKEVSREQGVAFEDDSQAVEYVALKHFNELHGTRYKTFGEARATGNHADDRAITDMLLDVGGAFLMRALRTMLAQRCMIDPGYVVAGAVGSRALSIPLIDAAPPEVGDNFLVGSPWRVGRTPFDWN